MNEPADLSSESALALRQRLQALTPARVGLGKTGVSQLTRDVLRFQVSHAQARDAVHARLDAATLAATFMAIGAAVAGGPVVRLHSAAANRTVYLQRPDLGRKLDEISLDRLRSIAPASFDLALIVADGLSALAVERHAAPLLEQLLPRLMNWKLAPICVVEQGRVAIGDEIGEVLRPEISLVLIGERPGLSSPDSLGAYITWQPRLGRTDAERNCISNIRPEGLNYSEAAAQLESYLCAVRQCQLTGVALQGAPSQLKEG
jgi:ethanolamine ammonia-lyase small subunit